MSIRSNLAKAALAALAICIQPAFGDGISNNGGLVGNQVINSTSGDALTVNSGTGSTDNGIVVNRGIGGKSALDLHNPSPTFSGTQFMRVIKDTADGVTQIKVPWYVNGAGFQFMQTSLTISGTWTGTTNDGTNISPPSNDAIMLGLWSDVAGATIQSRASIAAGGHFLDLLNSSGQYVFGIDNDGTHRWDGGVANYASVTRTVLTPTAGVGLVLSGTAGNASLSLDNNASILFKDTGGTARIILQVDNSNALNLGAAALAGHIQVTPGTGKQFRVYDHSGNRIISGDEGTRTVALGVADILAALTAKTNSDTIKGIVSRANSATQSANLFEVQDSSSNVLAFVDPKGAHGFSKVTASGTAPGAGFAKIELVCGTNAGSAKLIVAAGTSAATFTILDNIGGGVTGC